MARAKTGDRAPAQPQPPEPFKKSTVREYFESICVAVILALFVRTFIVQAFKIPTGSMENNLLIGDHLLVNKFVFAPTLFASERAVLPIDPIRRGDILVFKYPEDPERDFIKRVVGLPGETVELKGQTVYIDGKALDEPYVHFLFPADAVPEGFDVRRQFGPVTVPADHYFMMGDNRDNSQDSRYWGFMPRSYVKGKALFIYFSFGEADQGGVAGLLGNARWGRILHQIH
jgi:signal peptidase I